MEANVESGQNLKQNEEDAEETKSHVNDNSIFYFEICRNCKASQKVQNTDDASNLILRAPNSKISQPIAAAVPQDNFVR